MKRLLIGLFLVSVFGCSPKVSTNLIKTFSPLDFNEEVIVLGIEEETPPMATELGTVKIGDTGFSTNCGWDVVIHRAKMEARKAGGNVLKLTEHIPPSAMGSSCDRIKATILKVESTAELLEREQNFSSFIDTTWNYAKFYVYRPGGLGSFIGYDVYLGDSIICRVTNSSKYEIEVTQSGLTTLWAKTESMAEVPVDIEFGREYYLRCSVGMGVMVGRPQLQLVDRKQGKLEYDSIKD